MLHLDFKMGFDRMERALLQLSGELRAKVTPTALTRTSVAVRKDVMAEMPKVFDSPTPFTVHSVRYAAATLESRAAKVYISDDAAKGLSPRSYLGPEIEGGAVASDLRPR